MKTNKYIKYALSFFWVLGACSDFLDYKDKDKVIPSTFEEYSELIYGDLIHQDAGNSCYNILIMSDDVESCINGNDKDERRQYLNWYRWAEDPQMTPDGVEMIDPAWEFLYHKILMCNVIEREVRTMQDDLEGKKFRLLGEVQTIRAMSYWYLVNMYGEPWRSSEQAKTAMGVPVNTESSILDKTYTRENLAKNYELIETDLKNALENLEKGEKKNTIFRPNKDVARLFLSRIYLEQKRYDEVVTVCTDLLKETQRTIVPMSWLKKNHDNWERNNPIVARDAGSLLFSWWTRNSMPALPPGAVGGFWISSELRNLVTENSNDIRGKSYTFWEESQYSPTKNFNKYKPTESKCYGMNYRLEEAYFNRAEAYIYLGNNDLAMNDLNKVYRERIMNESDPKLEADSEAKALEIFRKEKRKEFCFEDIRWFDIRRWGLAVEHVYHDYNDPAMFVTYILEAESPNYVLPLPRDVQRLNEKIERAQRVQFIVK